MSARTICLVLTTRGNYAKLKSLIHSIKEHPQLRLQIVVGGGLVLDKYGKILDDPNIGDFRVDRYVHFIIEGENPLTMTKSAGLAVTEFANVFNELKPDIVVVIADRFEVLSIAMAAVYMNIPIAHIEGGELSGSIDESIRHAVTKLSHLHFPASLEAAERIVKLGEKKEMVFHVGASSIDALSDMDLKDLDKVKEFQELHGVGKQQSLKKLDYLLVIQHPVTTAYHSNYEHVQETIASIRQLSRPTIWIWPNMDAGADGISKAIREYRESGDANNVYFFKSLSIEVYGPLLSNAGCIIGNSSSGVREASYLGIPCVNIGMRQQGRYRGSHVIDVDYNRNEISTAVLKQLAHGHYEPDYSYGSGGSAGKIVDVLSSVKIEQQKINAF